MREESGAEAKPPLPLPEPLPVRELEAPENRDCRSISTPPFAHADDDEDSSGAWLDDCLLARKR